MFFIHKGTVDVVSEDGTTVFASMKEGQFFGEVPHPHYSLPWQLSFSVIIVTLILCYRGYPYLTGPLSTLLFCMAGMRRSFRLV